MSGDKFTPGPWRRVHSHPDDVARPGIAFIEAHGHQFPDEIATLLGCQDPEQSANANLIAAAPLMLRALREVYACEFPLPDPVVACIRDAIAAAEGRS